MTRFGLLGPVSAWQDDREIDLGSPQQRALLALLILHRNEVVSTDRMIDALWPAGSPKKGLQVVRTYVSRLRAAGIAELSTHDHGYALRADADADRFEALVAAAHEEPDAVTVEALLTKALALVRGPPLPELPDDHRAAAERERLDELRADAEDALADSLLAQGRHRQLVPVLRTRLAAGPLRERTWEQLMVALYRCGRQTKALEAYREAQRALDEVGLVPGVSLRSLERMVLLHDAALDAPAEHPLPRYHTSFVGRDVDVAAVAAAVRSWPLVTIVGPAGVGKTRLAVEVVAGTDLRPWWVDLGSTAAGRVTATVAAALAVPQVPGRAAADLVAARLGEAPALLLLDNCEHVAGEAAGLAEHLVQRCGRILATSRQPLHVDGECVRRLEGLETRAAVRLFLDRAGLRESDGVTEVVEYLDGLPLAIELAAGKLEWVSAPELARELRQRLSLLADGSRTSPARQRTLEDAIAWSHDLLSSHEQRVLRQLATFHGGFDASAAAAVAGGELPVLTRLADASLLVAERDEDATRYRLLVTVRAFARERLAEAGETAAAARRHRDHYLALARELDPNMTGAGLAAWLPRGRREHENLQAALRWSLERRETEPSLELAARLAMYWFRVGFVKDGRELLDRVLRDGDPASPNRPRALVGRAMLAHAAGAPDAPELAHQAVAACEAAGDDELLVYALAWRANALIVAGRLDEARGLLDRTRAVAEAVGSEEGVAFADQLLGGLVHRAGDLEAAGELLVRARDRFRSFRAPLDAGYTLVDLAHVRLSQGRAREALAVAGEALADFRRREDPRGIGVAYALLGHAYSMLDESERARPLLDEARALARRWGFALPVSGELGEAGQEPSLGAGVEPLAPEEATAVLGVRREQGQREPGVAEQLR